jgi:hypothetical protein
MFRTLLVHHQLHKTIDVLPDDGPVRSETCSGVVFYDNCVRLLVNSKKNRDKMHGWKI